MRELSALPDDDIRAMATYLASFQSKKGRTGEEGMAKADLTTAVTTPSADSANMTTSSDASSNTSFDTAFDSQAAAAAQAVVQHAALAATRSTLTLPGPAQRLFNGACGACHHDGDGPRLLGVNTPLALNTNLHSDRPDNLLQVILNGIQEPAGKDIGFMPAFKYSLSDAQIAELASYMRQRYAPVKAAWRDLPQAVARVRALR